MFNTSNGTVRNGDIHLWRGQTREEFLATDAGANARPMVENRDWVTYRIAADTQKAFFIVQFKSGVIEQVRITLALDGDDPKRWTIASEAARKSLHDRMLREQIGLPPYRFDWGKIESVSDARNGASEIIVTYE